MGALVEMNALLGERLEGGRGRGTSEMESVE
jgi:hypothetical protein